jgi:hypothetical protein
MGITGEPATVGVIALGATSTTEGISASTLDVTDVVDVGGTIFLFFLLLNRFFMLLLLRFLKIQEQAQLFYGSTFLVKALEFLECENNLNQTHRR